MSAVSTESAYVGRVDEACYVVPVVDERPPDAVELCMGDPGGVVLLRERLRQLNEQAVGMSGWCFALPSD